MDWLMLHGKWIVGGMCLVMLALFIIDEKYAKLSTLVSSLISPTPMPTDSVEHMAKREALANAAYDDVTYQCPKGHTYEGERSELLNDVDDGQTCRVCVAEWMAANFPRATVQR